MKIILLGCLLSLLTSCGSNSTNTKTTKFVEVPVEVETTVEVEVHQELEGYYPLPFGGHIELLADHRGDITVETRSFVMSHNYKSDTYAEHPTVIGNGLQIVEGGLQWSRNVRYTTKHNVEDFDGNVIEGVKRTDYSINLDADGNLLLTLYIWNGKLTNNANHIIYVMDLM